MNTSSSTSTPSTSSPTTGGAYIPGVCNINTAEVAYRRKAGYVLLAITVVIAAGLLIPGLPHWLRVAIAAPTFVTAVCFLQVKYKFCVNYGANGKQNATDGDKVAQDIVDKAALKLDQDRTRKIKLQAAAIAAVVALVFALLPV